MGHIASEGTCTYDDKYRRKGDITLCNLPPDLDSPFGFEEPSHPDVLAQKEICNPEEYRYGNDFPDKIEKLGNPFRQVQE